jgi:hypothetical protein
MRLPSTLLPDRITVEPYLGNGATGPQYGPPVGVRARIEGKRRVVRRVNAGADIGSDVVSTTSTIIRPSIQVRPESRVTIPLAYSATGRDESYEVLQVIVGKGLRRPAYLELVLG